MKTNTKNFLKLIEKIKNNDNNITLNKIVYDFKEAGFSLDDEIKIIYTSKNLKPSDLEKYENGSNILYFITALKQKDSNNLYFYAYKYECGKIKEAHCFYHFTNYSYKTNAENRKNALYTILLIQDSNYTVLNNEKRKTRAENNQTSEKRYILKKDCFISDCSVIEERQRYKYFEMGTDPKKKTFINNLSKKELYNFTKYNYNYYYNSKIEVAMDKSGYILTEKRKDLKQRALKLKEARALENFNNYNKNFYITALKKDLQVLEAQTLESYKKACNDGLKSIENMNKLYKYIKDIKNELLYYINKLENNNYKDVLLLEKDLQNIHKDYYNYIYEIAHEKNKYLNFDILYDEIQNQVGGFSNFQNLFIKNNMQWSAPVNIYKNNNDKIKIENGFIYFLGYKKRFENYFKFLEN